MLQTAFQNHKGDWMSPGRLPISPHFLEPCGPMILQWRFDAAEKTD